MDKVHITDTVLRDGHQWSRSRRGCARRTCCPSAPSWTRWATVAGSLGGATYDACLRFLKEDPWERLRALRAALPNTRLQMLLRGQNLLGYRHYADDVVRAFVLRAADNGMDVFRIFDALNDLRNLRTAIEATQEAGKHAQGTICYTTSPVHSTAGFVAQGRELAAMGCASIAIEDMAGLLTPPLPKPWSRACWTRWRCRCICIPTPLRGLAEMCQLKAIEAGCRHIDTAISSFAGGTSHPPTESMVAALRGTAHDTGLDLERLQNIAAYFREVRKKYRQFESDYTGVDTRVQVNQVPGGMISPGESVARAECARPHGRRVRRDSPRARRLAYRRW